MTRVLGVDPGLTRCGVGIVDSSVTRKLSLVGVGVVRTSPDQDHAHRLLAIEQGLEEWVQTYRPDAIAVERVFAQHNLHSVTGTSQVAGIAMLIAARHSIPVALHTPSEVKAAVTGSGRADKAQVGLMVARILQLAESPKPAATLSTIPPLSGSAPAESAAPVAPPTPPHSADPFDPAEFNRGRSAVPVVPTPSESVPTTTAPQ